MKLELTEDEINTLFGIFIGMEYMDSDEEALEKRVSAIWYEMHKDVLKKLKPTTNGISEPLSVTMGSVSSARR